MRQKRKQLAKTSRTYRKLHRAIAIPLVVFMFLLGATGLLLTWKDQLQFKPSTQTINANNRVLISLDKIKSNAIAYIDSLNLSSEINRIDYRPSKGVAKVRFENHFTELQVDCYTGKIISEKTRTADVIEMIHDGSIIDFLFKNQSTPVKFMYSTITSLGLMLLSFSGFWLWIKPKQIKKLKE
ncbi:PepSY domain-containing protein [Winogradskyella echinorum]|uniref:PepSY domain-containing protein n=1 Tax=Winogradskyella echinorum TaxID=538189 RepID=A0ABR6Y3C1_9FLAO|nr:PepSY domain-containing protein [Winogradskyella echinorum]MBC3847174.1 PepSY domain-containing protein [Winogradskyella echinorum]MBC5751522.1 PepSY domain-containing protein [Winogradskyella echinorum]